VSECPLTELPPEQCACRNHRGGTAPDEFLVVSPAWEAMFPGPCARGDRIQVGERIVRTSDNEFLHERCAT
jgi:hypothetical protein